MPARASARSADWAPGPGVLVTTGGTQGNVDRVDVERLALGGDVLGGHHRGVRGGLIAVSLDLHAPSPLDDGFAARDIGHVDEGVVERREDVRDAEDDLALADLRAQRHLLGLLALSLPPATHGCV